MKDVINKQNKNMDTSMSSDVGYYDALRNLDSDLGGFKDKNKNDNKKPSK